MHFSVFLVDIFISLLNFSPASASFIYFFLYFFSFQYAAKEYQQALDILDMEEPASKKLLDKGPKEDNGTRETTKEWEMSPASVSISFLLRNLTQKKNT